MKKLIPCTLLALLLLFSCKQSSNKKITTLPQVNPLVTSFTGGKVSRFEAISVVLGQEVDSATRAAHAPDFITIRPSVNGQVIWVDDHSFIFKPAEAFEPGADYTVKLNLRKLFANADPSYKEFSFPIEVLPRTFTIKVEGIFSETHDKDRYYIEGNVAFTDDEKQEEVAQLLQATYHNKPMEVVWEQNGSPKNWRFTLAGIQRGDTENNVQLEFNGKNMGIAQSFSETIPVPGKECFRILNVQAVQQENQHLIIEFSDPLDKKQEFTGLVKINDVEKLRYVVESNVLKVYFEQRLTGEQRVTISEDIRSKEGKSLLTGMENEVQFQAIYPDMRFIGKGTIIPPSGKGALVNFETVNLKAVDLYIIRIYEQNVVQFLQSNRLNGNSSDDLVKTGRLIVKKKIDLVSDRVLNYGKWNAFSFDISELVEVEPGAIYSLELRMQQEYSTYPCDESNKIYPPENDDAWEPQDNLEDWDNIRYWSTYRSYRYRDRDNPCAYSYYNARSATRNVLVSDLGMIAKKDANNGIRVYVNSLKTALPIVGAPVTVLDYQGVKIAGDVTDKGGLVDLQVSRKPYLARVENGPERGYLRLDDNTALSYSNFDVSGEKVQKGLKGLIYGERGVWRPGDSIFVTFVLEDKARTLPANHPVEFTLTNPKGQVTKRLVSTRGINGFYPFRVKTETTDPTGYWNATVRVGDAQFHKSIRVETVKPNRLKIELKTENKSITSTNGTERAFLNVKWLHGAPAKQVKINSEVSYLPGKTSFEGFPNYSFSDPSANFVSIPQTVFEGNTNAEGDASFPLKLPKVENAPGMLLARFYTRAFERGGDFSSNVTTIPFSPYSAYVGVKAPDLPRDRYYYDTGNAYTFDVATVNDQGNAVSMANVEVTLYKISWRWWWSSGEDNLGYYIGRNNYESRTTRTIRTVNGKGTVTFQLNDHDWGRYYLKVTLPNGHSCGKVVYFDWPYGNRKDGPGGATLLQFTSDKKEYVVGEEVHLNLPGGDQARALVSIENGSSIVKDFWVDLKEKQNKVSFLVEPEMAPNVFVNVTLIQPHANTANDNPIRMYGIIPVLVEDPATRLQPEISIPDVIEPETTVQIKVTEKNGKKMTYTLAVVEEGLLDLTNFKTPDLHAAFYAREAHGIATWDLYDEVTGAFGGTLEKIFAIGGDDALNEKSKKEANRFKPVVKYFGPFTLEAGKTATLPYTMPRYIGAVRTMVIAGDQGKYGHAEKSSKVKSTLMVLGTLPRVLGPQESVKLPVTLFAMNPRVKNVNVSVNTEGNLQVVGEAQKSLTFAEEGEQMLYFDLKTTANTGMGKVHIVATGGGKTAHYDVELNVRHPLQKVTTTQTLLVQPGEQIDQAVNLPGMAGTNALQVDVSAIPAMNLTKRLDYLIRYPYGCIEQTTSAVFPQIYVSGLMELSDARQKQIQENVQQGIRRIQNFQVSSGGFSYWPGGSEADNWGSNYAGHFLLEAEKMGFYVPSQLKSKWISYQKKAANDFINPYQTSNSYRYREGAQAYRLYTLALAGQPAYGAMNRLWNNKKLNKQSKWLLALAYAHAGRPETALELLDVRDLDVEEYTDMGFSYGSAFRDKAILLETLTATKYKDEAYNLVLQVSKVLNSDQWLSTQETAWALRAVAGFYQVHATNEGKAEFQLKVGESLNQKSSIAGKLMTFPVKTEKVSEQVQFSNTGNQVLFLTLVGTGVPEVGQEAAEEKHLSMQVNYVDENNLPVNVDALPQGTDFIARVTVKYDGVNKALHNLVLRQIFPSGWEILNARLFTGEASPKNTVPDYVDVRDDRVYTFFSLEKGKTATFDVRLNAAYAGRYYLPQVSVETMYSDQYYARNAGQWVEVKQE